MVVGQVIRTILESWDGVARFEEEGWNVPASMRSISTWQEAEHLAWLGPVLTNIFRTPDTLRDLGMMRLEGRE